MSKAASQSAVLSPGTVQLVIYSSTLASTNTRSIKSLEKTQKSIKIHSRVGCCAFKDIQTCLYGASVANTVQWLCQKLKKIKNAVHSTL